MKIAVNVLCLTKKTEEKSDNRERSYDFMNAGIRKRKIRPFRDASALKLCNKCNMASCARYCRTVLIYIYVHPYYVLYTALLIS